MISGIARTLPAKLLLTIRRRWPVVLAVVALGGCDDPAGVHPGPSGVPGLYAVQPLHGFDASPEPWLAAHGTETFARRLSAEGLAVGTTSDLPVRWIAGIPQAIEPVTANPDVARWHGWQVHSVNRSGVLVGAVGGSLVGPVRAWVLRDGVMEELPTLGDEAVALDINDRGDIAGASSAEFQYRHAVRWRDGRLERLVTVASWQSRATAIDNEGRVVGWFGVGDALASHAFLWEEGGMIDLGTLQESLPNELPFESVAEGINERRQVVGWTGRQEARQAFIWESGRMRGLDAGPSIARAINDAEDIVGVARLPVGWRAVLWRGGIRYDLNEYLQDRRILLTEAMDINEAGQILALGHIPGQNGARSVILTPLRRD